MAPYPTLDYDSVHSLAQPIAFDLIARTMPPWGADNSGACGTWQDAHWLSDRELSTLEEWLSSDQPMGPADVVSSASPIPDTPFFPDLSLDIGGVYQPGLGAGGNRCFVTDPSLDRDRLLTAIRVVSDDPRAVAQVTLFDLDSDAADAEVSALDAAEEGLGYSCFGTTRSDDARLVSSWTAPTPVLRMPAGVGVRLSAGHKMIVQIHYDVARTSSSFASGTHVDLELNDAVAEARVLKVAASSTLPAGRSSVPVDVTQPISERMRVLALAPRMHIRGKELNLIAERPNGAACLGSFRNWNFNREQLFRSVTPVVVEAGDRFHLYCTFGTLGRSIPVSFGDAIDDEECVAYLLVAK